MTEAKANIIISDEEVLNKIHILRGKKVMLDSDLSELYGVETKLLKRSVNRNIDRFPIDFMFELTQEEYNSLRSQIGTLKRGEHAKYLPYVFTEQGVAMLSSVLNSEIAIKVNIQIIRIFSRMRELLLTHKEILLKLEQLEKKLTNHDEEIEVIFDTLKELISPPTKERKKIGYKLPEKK
jgi:hypothetical protein